MYRRPIRSGNFVGAKGGYEHSLWGCNDSVRTLKHVLLGDQRQKGSWPIRELRATTLCGATSSSGYSARRPTNPLLVGPQVRNAVAGKDPGGDSLLYEGADGLIDRSTQLGF